MPSSKKNPAQTQELASSAQPKIDATEPSAPSREILATLASRLMKEGVGVDQAVKTAWKLLKAADELLKYEIPREIRQEQMRREMKMEQNRVSKQVQRAIREITSQKRKDRAFEYFKQFLRGSASKRGRSINNSLEDFKTYKQYLDEGIDSKEITKLKRLYEQAFPNRKKKSTPPAEPQISITRPRKIDICEDEFTAGDELN